MQKPEITGLRNLSKLKKLVICACAKFENGRIQIVPTEKNQSSLWRFEKGCPRGEGVQGFSLSS